ncbi:SDR family NAD(P)-dependent oxidoreductase [Rathayibacter oskolensis]|uniref:SDR family NAD(P)-dependent oxidoreductase n=1 Tax=Rathayibacter oskolensis TaxID=1891671 RepID=UPI00265F4110|nr:SDR family NAD(P)-dependent oxidoreductase [Rathayibacter oskolensis]WKK73093.1 SDR family NAD(P)-dependent oxidoreductase [Rathayibacter oskolensis]
MLIDFTGHVVVVTGAGQGIGRVIAESFAEDGATVVLLDVAEPLLRDVGAHLDARGLASAQYVCDVRDAAAVERVMDDVVSRFGRIDTLINNAGVNVVGLIEDLDVDSWDRCFEVNVRGTFTTCKAVLPVMKRQRRGRIINAASFAAIVPSVGGAAYAASKAAVVQFTRTLAGEAGPWDITANSYAPGMVPTAMNGFAELSEESQAEKLDMLAVRRWGEAQDIADLLRFVASDFAGYITGTLLEVSGGKLATQTARAAAEQRP